MENHAARVKENQITVAKQRQLWYYTLYYSISRADFQQIFEDFRKKIFHISMFFVQSEKKSLE
jgi:hypothetical protein